MTSQFSADAQNGDRMRLCLRGSGGVRGDLPAERGYGMKSVLAGNAAR